MLSCVVIQLARSHKEETRKLEKVLYSHSLPLLASTDLCRPVTISVHACVSFCVCRVSIPLSTLCVPRQRRSPRMEQCYTQGMAPSNRTKQKHTLPTLTQLCGPGLLPGQ